MAGLLGGVVGTMLDPLIILCGVACYFIERRHGAPGLVASIIMAAVGLFILALVLAGGSLSPQVLFLYLIAIASWAGLIIGAVALVDLYKRSMPS